MANDGPEPEREPWKPHDVFKVVVMGASKVGKTNLIGRYVNNEFVSTYQATIGGDFQLARRWLGDRFVSATIWDCPGSQRFRTMVAAFAMRKADVAILVYDTTDLNSFEEIGSWLRDLRAETQDEDPVITLVGNKSDLAAERAVPIEMAHNYAHEQGLFFFETSALDASNVGEMFQGSITEKVERKLLAEHPVQPTEETTREDS